MHLEGFYLKPSYTDIAPRQFISVYTAETQTILRGERELADQELFGCLVDHHVTPDTLTIPINDQIVRFRNPDIARLATPALTELCGLARLETTLRNVGALRVNIRDVALTRQGAPAENITIIGASERGKGQMTNAIWIRDQTQIVQAYVDAWDSNPRLYADQGHVARSVLFSLLTLMSTPAQLKRFEKIIERKDDANFVDNPHNWPHIFLNLDNLNGEKTEGWAHKQDAWQMLVIATFDALEKGLIKIDDLTEDHKQFLSLAVPFLAAVEYWQRADSGSWEEIEAVRSSTMAWNIAVIDKIREYVDQEGFDFLHSAYENVQTFTSEAGRLINKGMEKLVSMMPFESPTYNTSDPCYRQADAALIYLLQLDFPKRLAQFHLPQDDQQQEREEYAARCEAHLLEQIYTLVDDQTNGIKRYHKDSYQRKNFWTPSAQADLMKMYQSATGDYSRTVSFVGRDRVIPKGREAAWTHPNFQLSSWAGRRYRETGDKKYLDLQQLFLLRGLSMVTRNNDLSILQTPTGITIQKLPPRVPECYITLQSPHSQEYVLPGPFTPLNWATALCQAAIVDMRKSMLAQIDL